MFIDVMVIIAVVGALFKGYKLGFIMALFNVLSLIVGLAASVKLSSVVSPWLASEFGIESKYLPFLSFVLVFLAVVMTIRFLAGLIQKTLETMKVGFVNRIAGAALYLFLYLSFVSILLYYVDKMGFLPEDTVNKSATAGFILPWGPAVLNGLGFIIPYFKDMFDTLNQFFQQLADGAKQPG